jgi:site-specific recombinase XerD
LILDFVEDARNGKTIKNKAKKKISPSRCTKYVYELRKLSAWFDKPFDKVTAKDMEKVVRNLEENRYRKESVQGQAGNYSEKTKLDFKKDLRKFFKWLHGDSQKFHALTGWIDTHDEIQEVPALLRAEAEKIAAACDTRDKTIIMILYDSGARIEEFLNVRIGDLTKKEDGNYYMIRIKHSKTKPRTISIPMCTEVLENWLAIHPESNNPNAQLFPLAYDAVRMMLKRVGRRILKKEVYPHLLRHSSATYYCHMLNQYQLCYRYGWTMSSKQPARYIDREGIHEEKTAELVKDDDMGKLKKAVQETNENYAGLKEDYEALRKLVVRILPAAKVMDKAMKSPDSEELLARITEELIEKGVVEVPS